MIDFLKLQKLENTEISPCLSYLIQINNLKKNGEITQKHFNLIEKKLKEIENIYFIFNEKIKEVENDIYIINYNNNKIIG